MSSSQQTQGDGSMQGSHLPNMSGESAIPASFFDIPIEYESTDGNINMDFASISGFPATDTPMPNAPDFDALTVQIAANMPPLDSFSTYPMASPSQMAQAPQPNPTNMAIKMELDDLSSIAPSPSIASEVSTSKPSSLKAKKPSKQKADGTETKPKPKKPKKKSTTGAATTDATAFSSSAQPSNVTAASTAPKPKKTSKNKASDKDKSKEEAHQQPTSTAASPAPFATPVSSSKESKPKAKKAGGSKVGTKAGSKARSSTARSASRKSSMGRDATTPAASRVDSQRPNDEANDDDEPASNVQAPPPEEDEEAEDEEADADDGVEELGRDHFSTQEAIYAAQQRNMGLLSMVMDEDQLDRHMASRRGALNKTNVRKLVNHVLSQSVSQHVAMVVSGVAKIFVGEIIETAREIQSIRGEHGPLRPNHLREAHRQYYLKRERPGHYPPGTNTGHPGVGKRRRLF